MNKIQAYLEAENIKMAVWLAKNRYFDKRDIGGKDLHLLSGLYNNARKIKMYLSENEDFKLLEKVATIERGWLYHLINDYNLPEDVVFSINKASRILLDLDNIRKEMDVQHEEETITSNQHEEETITSNGNNVRSIKEEELKAYFKLSFRGGGNCNMDYFTNNLLPDLRQNRSDKDFAKIALLIHESDKLISSMRPNPFKEWYRIFCELVGCRFHKEYKPNKLKSDEAFRRKFYYL